MAAGLMGRLGLALLAAIAAAAVVVAFVDVVLKPQSGPFALAAVVEGHLLAVGAVAGILAVAATGRWGRGATWIRLLAVVVVVVALVRLGGEWWSPGVDDPGHAQAGQTRLTVMSWNLELGSKAADDVLAGIAFPETERPGLVALQELTPEVAQAIEADPDIDGIWPYRILEPRSGVAGVGLLSQYPLVIGSYATGPVVLRAGLLLPDGRRLELFDVHPYPPTIDRLSYLPVGLDTHRRDRDLEQIRREVDALDDPSIALVIGDLNATPFEAGFAVLADGLHDAHAEAASGTGFTWRPSSLEALRIGFLRMDVVLSGATLRPVAASEDCSIAGDHCRLFATLIVDAAPE